MACMWSLSEAVWRLVVGGRRSPVKQVAACACVLCLVYVVQGRPCCQQVFEGKHEGHKGAGRGQCEGDTEAGGDTLQPVLIGGLPRGS